MMQGNFNVNVERIRHVLNNKVNIMTFKKLVVAVQPTRKIFGRCADVIAQLSCYLIPYSHSLCMISQR